MNEQFIDTDFSAAGMQKEDVSIEELNEALVTLRNCELEASDSKKIYLGLFHKQQAAKQKFIDLLKAAGKNRWECKGVTGFTMYDELKFRVPQGPESKDKFFKFIQSPVVSKLMELEPRDIFLKYATVSSQSIGPLCKMLKKLAAEKGMDIEIEGLLPPTSEPKLRSIPKQRKE
tara:strand:- start:61 stop:582 length:522 start_codon:yes stop_codon:yes gene_type:complete